MVFQTNSVHQALPHPSTPSPSPQRRVVDTEILHPLATDRRTRVDVESIGSRRGEREEGDTERSLGQRRRLRSELLPRPVLCVLQCRYRKQGLGIIRSLWETFDGWFPGSIPWRRSKEMHRGEELQSQRVLVSHLSYGPFQEGHESYGQRNEVLSSAKQSTSHRFGRWSPFRTASLFNTNPRFQVDSVQQWRLLRHETYKISTNRATINEETTVHEGGGRETKSVLFSPLLWSTAPRRHRFKLLCFKPNAPASCTFFFAFFVRARVCTVSSAVCRTR